MGIALGTIATPGEVLVTALVIAFVGTAVIRRPRFGVLLGLLLFTGAAIGDARTEKITRSALTQHVGRHVEVHGWLVRDSRATGFSRISQVKLGRARLRDLGTIETSETVLIRASLDRSMPKARVGDEIVVNGRLRMPSDRLGDGFNWRQYLRRHGISVEVVAERIERGPGRRGGIRRGVDDIKARSERALGVGIDNRFSSLSRGMVLGADEGIDRDTIEEFRRSGLAHLLAVSGQNVMLLVILTIPILSIAGFGYRARLVALLPLIGIYTLITGADPPIQRAAVMATAGIVAALAGRGRVSWYALLIAAVVTLAINPMAVTDAGWQLSFAAVVSIFWLAPKIEGVMGSLPRALAQGAAITAAATIFTAPLMAHHFERVSVVSLAANLLALPLVAPIMWLGMLASTVGQFWLAPAYLINKVDTVCLAYLLRVAEWSSDQRFAVVQISLPEWWQVALAYGALFASVIAVGFVFRTPKWRYIVTAVSAVTLIALLSGAIPHRPTGGSRPDNFTATFIDVGQGDATLLQTPVGQAVLVDAGPPGVRLFEKLQELGVKQLDLVVLTHAQMDHYGGIGDLSQHIRVGTALVGSGSASRSYNDALASLERKGAKIVEAEAGQTVKLGRLALSVLYPESTIADRSAGSDPNNDAIVIYASYGSFDLFLPADAESGIWGSIELPDVEVYKVAHHGSADEGLEMALKRLKPDVAVISVGRDNRFGHPNPETTSSLKDVGARILRTDRDGTVTVRYQADRGLLVSSKD